MLNCYDAPLIIGHQNKLRLIAVFYSVRIEIRFLPEENGCHL